MMIRAATLIAAVFATGCLGPRSDPSTFYLLSAAAAPGPASVPVTLGIGPITLPAYLDRPQIVTRLSEHQVALSEVERWAEPLHGNVSRALADNLARSLRFDGWVEYPWHSSVSVDYGVSVEFARFEADTSGVVRLEAKWQVREGPSGVIVQGGTTGLEELAAGEGTESAIAALSRALARLADELAAVIRRAHGTAG